MASTTRHAKSGEVHIAYRTLGSARVDVVVAEQWFSNVEIEREVRPLARFNDRLSVFARVVRFDNAVNLRDVRVVQGRPHTLPTSTTPRNTSRSLAHTMRSKASCLALSGTGISMGDST